jgi:uncharacterized protein (DUF433 family)
MENLDRISIKAKVMGGKPCIKGTRVTVDTIVSLINSGVAPNDILDRYPYLLQEDIEAGLLYATNHSRSKILEDISEAVIELNLILAGNHKAKDADELLKDL